MFKRWRRPPGGPLLDSGNRTGNPLRPYRMAMLAHGFVEREDRRGFEADETDPMNYGIVKLRGGSFPTVAVVAVGLIVVGVVIALLLF